MLSDSIIELGKHLIEQPVNYKYFKADTAITVLTEDKLQFTHPSDFNDPFDCNVHLFEFDEKEVRLYKNEVSKKYKGNNYLERFRLHRRYNDKIRPVAKEYMQNIFINENSDRGITCFSKNNLQMLMWAHYADNHKGVCIGYDLLALQDYVSKKNTESCLLPVEYQEKITLLKDFQSIESVMAMFRTKHILWSYEEEIRLITRPLVFDKNRKHYFRIPVEIIKEIYLRTSLDAEKRTEILKLVKDRFPHVKIFEVKPDYNSFALMKEQLIY